MIMNKKELFMFILRALLIIFILFIPAFSVFANKTEVDVTSIIQLEREENLLTVKESQISLEKILTEIANQTDIKFVFLISLEGSFHSSFCRLPLEKGLKQLLHGFNYSIIFGSEKSRGGEQEIRKVVVLSREGDSYRGNRGTVTSSPGALAPESGSEEILNEMEMVEIEGGGRIDAEEDDNQTSGGSLINEIYEQITEDEIPEEIGGGRTQIPEEGETENDPVNEAMLREIEREEMERGEGIDDEEGV
jgi:hypothetical protein